MDNHSSRPGDFGHCSRRLLRQQAHYAALVDSGTIQLAVLDEASAEDDCSGGSGSRHTPRTAAAATTKHHRPRRKRLLVTHKQFPHADECRALFAY